jgi:prevent-host-death family protein
MNSASVTELKNQLSAHLKAVMGGKPLLITDRRKPVALLQPLGKDFWDERVSGLVAAGIVSPPKKALRVRDFLKRPRARSAKSLTSAVMEDREGR